MLEPPYGTIAGQFKQGAVIPFLGAGASLCGRLPGVRWDARTAAFLPTGGELACQLAEDCGFPSSDPYDCCDLAKVASYYIAKPADRGLLRDYMRQTFDRDYCLGAIHRFLAELDTPLLIVTTNYDDLIERAFKAQGKPYHVVAYPTDHKEYAASVLWWKPNATQPEPCRPNELPLSLTDTTIIYKMHGTVDRHDKKWDSFVITEEDYVDFLARMTGQTAIPARFMLEFRKRRFLFIGYGLRDWNLRVMLRNLKMSLPAPDMGAIAGATVGETTGSAPEETRSWAVQRSPSELELALWDARKVSIYDIDIDTFVAKLRAEMGLSAPA